MNSNWIRGHLDKTKFDRGETTGELKADSLVFLQFSWSTFADDEMKNFSHVRVPKALTRFLFTVSLQNGFREEFGLRFLFPEVFHFNFSSRSSFTMSRATYLSSVLLLFDNLPSWSKPSCSLSIHTTDWQGIRVSGFLSSLGNIEVRRSCLSPICFHPVPNHSWEGLRSFQQKTDSRFSAVASKKNKLSISFLLFQIWLKLHF